jgi:hypothetical protein
LHLWKFHYGGIMPHVDSIFKQTDFIAVRLALTPGQKDRAPSQQPPQHRNFM